MKRTLVMAAFAILAHWALLAPTVAQGPPIRCQPIGNGIEQCFVGRCTKTGCDWVFTQLCIDYPAYFGIAPGATKPAEHPAGCVPIPAQ
jgi:hypothetical protein